MSLVPFLKIVMAGMTLVMPQVWAQGEPMRNFHKAEFDESVYSRFSEGKEIPGSIRQQALIALSYFPELQEVPIVFRFRKRKTPLTSRPRIGSVFQKKGKRTYVITISSSSISRLQPILLDRLPYNAQIGVLGHELSHITIYREKSSFGLMGLLFMLLDSKKTDEFEFNTDRVCIEHGLGYQLLDWSLYVRNALEVSNWKGPKHTEKKGRRKSSRQRYMDPETIQYYMDNYSELY